MPEYIEREYAVDAVLDVYFNTPDINLSCEKFEAVILEIPTADVAPVRHGRWMDNEDYMFCSCCGMQWNYCDNDTQDFHYCPNCGAKMGGDEE